MDTLLTKKNINLFMPLGVVMLLQKLNIEEMGLIEHLRIVYILVQICAILALLYIKNKIPEGGADVECPEESAMGKVVKPKRTLTVGVYFYFVTHFSKKKIGFSIFFLALVLCFPSEYSQTLRNQHYLAEKSKIQKTSQQYDKERWNEDVKKILIGAGVLCLLHFKWQVFNS